MSGIELYVESECGYNYLGQPSQPKVTLGFALEAEKERLVLAGGGFVVGDSAWQVGGRLLLAAAGDHPQHQAAAARHLRLYPAPAQLELQFGLCPRLSCKLRKRPKINF